jgi:protein-S-isoprenylcysteine O-methyltransferase Ste14
VPVEDDPEKRIADLERQLAEARAAENPKLERRERRMRVREEAGISRAQWQVERIVAVTLAALSVVGLTLLFVGDGTLIWIGLALFVGAAAVLVTLSRVRNRSIEKVRWQHGTVTFRTVEPGDVGEPVSGWTARSS